MVLGGVLPKLFLERRICFRKFRGEVARGLLANIFPERANFIEDFRGEDLSLVEGFLFRTGGLLAKTFPENGIWSRKFSHQVVQGLMAKFSRQRGNFFQKIRRGLRQKFPREGELFQAEGLLVRIIFHGDLFSTNFRANVGWVCAGKS